LYCSIILYFIL